MKRIQNPRLLTCEMLIMELCDNEAEMECLDSGLGLSKPALIQVLSTQIHSLKTELLGRMDKNPNNEELVSKLVKLYKDAVNSGEDKSPELRTELELKKAQILKRIGDLQTA